MKRIEDVDLRLLLAFDALVVERHVSRAGDRLGLTQPAMSHALKRLRLVFEDDILARGPDGLQPTRRAIELHAQISRILESVRALVEEPRGFDPSTCRSGFTIGTSDAVALMLLPDLVRRMREAAPGARLTAVQCSAVDGLRQVRTGEMDIAIGVFSDLPPGVRGVTLSTASNFFAFVDRRHPALVDGRLDRDAYLASPHVGVEVFSALGSAIDSALEGLGLSRTIAMVAPNFNVVPAIVRGTDMVGHCTWQVVDQLAFRDEFAVFPPPLAMPPYRLDAIWREAGAGAQGRRWLAGLIQDVILKRETQDGLRT